MTVFFGYNCQRHAHSYYPDYLWSNRVKIALNNNPPIAGHASLPPGADHQDSQSYDLFKGQEYAPDLIHQEVLKFIKENQNNPFFLYYPTIIPHLALHVPDEELKPYLKLGWNDPPFTKAKGYGYTPHYTPRAAYAGMISRMDHYIGKVLKLLDDLGLAQNTIVVFTSDNGTSHLKEEVDYDFFNSVGDLRGLKGSLYEGGIRVPLLVRWADKIKAGSVSDMLSGFEDWMVTLHELIEAKTPLSNEQDGQSMRAHLLGEISEPRKFLYREFSGYGGQQAVWMGQWKGVRQNILRKGKKKESLKLELYDLSEDQSESRNLASVHPNIVSQIEEIMVQEHIPSSEFPIKGID